MRVVSLAFAARPQAQAFPLASLQVWCSSGASMPKMRYSLPSPARRLSPSMETILAPGPKGGVLAAIVLDEGGEDHQDHQRRELAELLRQRLGGPAVPCGLPLPVSVTNWPARCRRG
jgi:hypothetical protein